MAETAPVVLELSDVHAWYGESHVLHGMALQVRRGEVVTLLGRNGSGRSTTLKAILGMVSRRSGSIRVEGVETIGLPAHRIARLGLGYCPEERGIYSSLSVEENLLLPPEIAAGGMTLEEIYRMFPNLHERRATAHGTQLSGGEQQMLAMARILRTGARTITGARPSVISSSSRTRALGQVIHTLKARGFTIVLVEQNFRFAAPLADRHYVIEHGRVAQTLAGAEVNAKADVIHAYLGV